MHALRSSNLSCRRPFESTSAISDACPLSASALAALGEIGAGHDDAGTAGGDGSTALGVTVGEALGDAAGVSPADGGKLSGSSMMG